MHRVQRCGLYYFRCSGVCVHCVCVLVVTTVSCAETDELIEMPLGARIQVGPRNQILGGGSDPQGEGAILFACPGPL